MPVSRPWSRLPDQCIHSFAAIVSGTGELLLVDDESGGLDEALICLVELARNKAFASVTT